MSETSTAKPRRQPKRAALAAFVGTVLEWYDFILYGTAAAIILNTLFFPTQDPLIGTLAAFATYAVGFLARPLGGLFLGRLGDRVGRKRLLVITLFLMGGATVSIGLLPTYESIGVWAPILLVVMRLLQGFGAGGEYAGAVVLSVEHAKPKRRGLAGTAAPLGFSMGTLLANGIFALFFLMPRDQFEAWGWRIPFLLGALTVLVGYLIRRGVEEPEVFEKAKQERRTERPGLFSSIRRHPDSFFIVIATRMGENGFAYLIPVFGVAYVTTTVGLSESYALGAVMAASAVQLITVPLYGWLADQFGRKPVYAYGASLSVVWLVPYFLLVGTESVPLMFVGVLIGFGVFYPAMLAPQAAWYAELFDTEFRLSGFAFSREIGSVLSGGIAPFIATGLFAWTGHWWPVVLYMGIMGLITLYGLWKGPETLHKSIDETEPEPTPEKVSIN